MKLHLAESRASERTSDGGAATRLVSLANDIHGHVAHFNANQLPRLVVDASKAASADAGQDPSSRPSGDRSDALLTAILTQLGAVHHPPRPNDTADAATVNTWAIDVVQNFMVTPMIEVAEANLRVTELESILMRLGPCLGIEPQRMLDHTRSNPDWCQQDEHNRAFFEATMDVLRKDLEQSQLDAIRSQDRAQSAAQEMAACETQLREVTLENKRLLAELEHVKSQLQFQMDEAAASQVECEGRVSMLHAQNTELSQQMTDLNIQLEQAKGMIAQMQSELLTHQNQLTQSRLDAQSVAQEMANCESQLHEASQENGRLLAELEHTKLELKLRTDEAAASQVECEDRVRQCEARAFEVNERCTRLQTQFDDLTQRHDTAVQLYTRDMATLGSVIHQVAPCLEIGGNLEPQYAVMAVLEKTRQQPDWLVRLRGSNDQLEQANGRIAQMQVELESGRIQLQQANDRIMQLQLAAKDTATMQTHSELQLHRTNCDRILRPILTLTGAADVAALVAATPEDAIVDRIATAYHRRLVADKPLPFNADGPREFAEQAIRFISEQQKSIQNLTTEHNRCKESVNGIVGDVVNGLRMAASAMSVDPTTAYIAPVSASSLRSFTTQYVESLLRSVRQEFEGQAQATIRGVAEIWNAVSSLPQPTAIHELPEYVKHSVEAMLQSLESGIQRMIQQGPAWTESDPVKRRILGPIHQTLTAARTECDTKDEANRRSTAAAAECDALRSTLERIRERVTEDLAQDVVDLGDTLLPPPPPPPDAVMMDIDDAVMADVERWAARAALRRTQLRSLAQAFLTEEVLLAPPTTAPHSVDDLVRLFQERMKQVKSILGNAGGGGIEAIQRGIGEIMKRFGRQPNRSPAGGSLVDELIKLQDEDARRTAAMEECLRRIADEALRATEADRKHHDEVLPFDVDLAPSAAPQVAAALDCHAIETHVRTCFARAGALRKQVYDLVVGLRSAFGVDYSVTPDTLVQRCSNLTERLRAIEERLQLRPDLGRGLRPTAYGRTLDRLEELAKDSTHARVTLERIRAVFPNEGGDDIVGAVTAKVKGAEACRQGLIARQTEINTLASQLAEQERLYNVLKEENLRLNQRAKDAEARVEEHKARLENFEKLKTTSLRLVQLEDEANAARELDRLRLQHEELQRECETVRRSAKVTEDIAREWKMRYDELQASGQSVPPQEATMVPRNKHEYVIAELQTELDAKKTEHREAIQRIKELELLLGTVQQENTIVRSSSHVSGTELAQCRAENAALRAQVTAMAAASAERKGDGDGALLRAEIGRMRGEIAQLQAENAALRAQLATTTAAAASAERKGDGAQLRAEIERLTRALDATKQQALNAATECHTRYAQALEELRTERNARDAAMRRLDDWSIRAVSSGPPPPPPPPPLRPIDDANGCPLETFGSVTRGRSRR